MLAYVASKNEAERAVWRFRKEKKPTFTLSTILPGYVYGAVIPTPETLEDLKAASSANQVINYFSGANQDPTLTLQPLSFVDVAQVGLAHVRAIEGGHKTDGQRYLLNAGAYDFQQAVDVLRKTFPNRKDIIVEGQTGKYKDLSTPYDGSQATRELDIQYNSFEHVVLSTVNSVKHLY